MTCRARTPSLVTTAAAARALDISPSTLHRLRVAGVAIPAARTENGHARWDVEDLREQVTTHFDTLGRSKGQD